MKRILNSDEQAMVNGLAEQVVNALGKDNIDYVLYQALIEALKPAKELAKANYDKEAKERKEAEKELASANASKLHDLLKVDDTVDYLLKSKNALFKNVTVEKITDKRFHVSIDANTLVEVNGEATDVSSIADFKLGKKYIAFEAITAVNGKSVKDFLGE